MTPENTPNTTKICPTCGTRLGINATRCSVCGSNLAPNASAASAKAIAGPRIPEVTLSLPVIFGLGILLLVIGAGAVFVVLQNMNGGIATGALSVTQTATPTQTATITITPTATATGTPVPTETPLPPVEYTVASGDNCGSIAWNFHVAIQSIITLNQLPSDCTNLVVGQKLLIPQPTPTASPAPTSTLNPTEQVEAECTKVDYVVKDGDTLGGIAANYSVSQASIRNYNQKPDDTVRLGEKLIIPLCEQSSEAPTDTPEPPYAAPNLLLPADGASYTSPTDVITLQWASVGDLRQNEQYAVTIEDITEANPRKLVEYVPDTKFTVPESFRPAGTTPHIFRWSILPVRQTGTDKTTGNPIWEPAGSSSIQRAFTWVGNGSAPSNTQATPSPAP